ncbi:MAG: CD225/dispanin family protein [Candidatus Firestonebacteria bacterium]
MIKCKRCEKENDSKLWRCEVCNELLHEEQISREKKKKPKNYIVFSILLILSFIPTAIISFYYGLKVNSNFRAGDYDKAEVCSKKAKLWFWISIGISIILTIIFLKYILSMYNQLNPLINKQMQDILNQTR